MNAIVGFCHFCEAHGPRPVFCTYTTEDEQHTTEPSKNAVQCNGCTSIGSEMVLISRDGDTIFCSRESVPNPEVTSFLRQAALRSITCEVNWSKEGGVVYFSDTQGDVLSSTFQLKDTRSRGLKRLFSIVVLMKDKMLLLNITPVLSEHMQKIAKELQNLANEVYEQEQSICSQRALRLKTGRHDFGQSRSLVQLTGDADIFKKLHSHFTHILRIGAVTYSETLYTSHGLLNKITPQLTSNTIFQENACVVPNNNCLTLRELESLLTKEAFKKVLYCILTGVHIVIKCVNFEPTRIIDCLLKIIPSTNVDNNRPIVSVGGDNIETYGNCCIEEVENNDFVCKWNGSLPDKCPTLMRRIEIAMDNTKLTNAVLDQHIKSLQLEWLGIANTIKMAKTNSGKSDAIRKLKVVLGVMQQDEVLVNYWSCMFCS
ncbi:uncharacterized protein LOC116772673 isoform X1 [Danaus plexippus]|uniref:uncharacterized protein LOC116772673 isoform X1 n=2 Tax=Danaus plexippus TaxID=13037 RepID=UPI002AB009B3|nr:uncharacterized protein LOC116772673 isoform X1 [Danaus plexippus]